MKRKTYEQKIHYRVVIEGDFSCGNMLEEELSDTPEEYRWDFKEWLYESFTDVMNGPNCKIELSDLRTEEE
jgi:hypothetical protein